MTAALPPPPNTSLHNVVEDDKSLTRVYAQWFELMYNILSQAATQAPAVATYVLNVANALLPNAQVLSSLSTGFVKVANGTGLLSSQTSINPTDLTATGVTPGSYTINGSVSFIVNAAGQITSAASPVITTTGTADRITVTNGNTTAPVVDIANTYVGQTSITTLGTIITGTWTSTKIGLAYGGTNTDLSGTGGTSQVLKQTSVGGNLTVSQVTDADLSLSNITTNNVSTSKHGFAPVLPNDVTKFLDGTGNYSVPTGTSGVTVINIQTFVANGTYTPTANMKYCVIECLGGGGAGGSTAASTAGFNVSGGGGGAGSYAKKYASAATIGASKTVTVGLGGTAGATGNNPGGNGGDSSVTTICIGKGGTGGSGGTGVTPGTGGAGGVAGTGDVATVGSTGSDSLVSSTMTFCLQGMGAASTFGGAPGMQCPAAGTTGRAASLYGAGGNGGGSTNASAATAGGNGSAGIVIITEYI